MTDRRTDAETGVETTGHTWDGIEELNNPLPRWWLWTFYATVLWGLVYTILYPAWPLVDRATAGLLGWSTRAEVAAEIDAVARANEGLAAELVAIDLAGLADRGPLHDYAVNAGAAVFRTNCSQCHGSGAAGAKGYPNLLDDDWLWGGTVTQIAHTVRHGIRSEADPETRWSQMPAFGDILPDEDIAVLVEHVRRMADGGDPATGEGGALYLDNCASCHGEDGTGDRTVGAPNLVDAIWLYGNDRPALERTIAQARFGVMPPWGDRLGEAQVRAVAAYVHQLGGGEVEDAALGDETGRGGSGVPAPGPAAGETGDR